MRDTMKAKQIIFLLILFATVFSSNVFAQEYLYLFSQNAKFIKYDTSHYKIVDVGELGKIGFREVDGVTQDPDKEYLLINTPTWGILGVEPQTLDEFHKGGIAVLTELYTKGESHLDSHVETIGPSAPEIEYNGIKMINTKTKKIILADFFNTKTNQNMTIVYDGRTLKELQKIDGFYVLNNSFLSSDGTKLYTPQTIGYGGILVLDLKKMIVQELPYNKVGSAKFSPKNIVASKDGLMLVHGYQERPEGGVKGIFYLYDQDKEKTLLTMELDIEGDFHILRNGKGILLDEEKSESTKKVGKLHVYSPENGKEIALINLPEEGKFISFSPDEKIGYYFAPNVLTVVDLEKFKVLKSLEVPFFDAEVGLLKSATKP